MRVTASSAGRTPPLVIARSCSSAVGGGADSLWCVVLLALIKGATDAPMTTTRPTMTSVRRCLRKSKPKVFLSLTLRTDELLPRDLPNDALMRRAAGVVYLNIKRHRRVRL